MLVPPVVTAAALADELPGAQAWAQRHDVTVDVELLQERVIRVVLAQEDPVEIFYLQGTFESYRALPPVWQWYDETWSTNEGLHLSPNPTTPPCGSSVFMNYNGRPVICAPFNRLAYNISGGPHSDWGGPAQWMTPRPGCVRAVTIGDMLQSIFRDFRFTRGRMAS